MRVNISKIVPDPVPVPTTYHIELDMTQEEFDQLHLLMNFTTMIPNQLASHYATNSSSKENKRKFDKMLLKEVMDVIKREIYRSDGEIY